MALQDLSEDNEDFDIDETEEKDKEVKGNKGDLITNAGEIPLFHDADKRGLKAAQYLKIVKIDKPDSGYKGKIPISSTEETIAKLYGNGIYNIEACNHRHQIIRTIESLEISIPEEIKGVNPLMVPGLRNENSFVRQDNERVDRLHDKVTKQVTDNSNQFVQLVTKQTTESAQREREHMASVNNQQQTFFSSMLAATSQMFQQQILLQREQHQQTLQLLATNKPNENQGMQMLLAGIALAKELGSGGEGDNTPDWLKALSQGGEMLGNLVKLSEVKKNPNVKLLKALRAKKKLLAKNKEEPPTPEPKQVPEPGNSEKVPNSGIDFESIFDDTSKEESKVISEETENDDSSGDYEDEERGES
jgi:hypothetical protein